MTCQLLLNCTIKRKRKPATLCLIAVEGVIRGFRWGIGRKWGEEGDERASPPFGTDAQKGGSTATICTSTELSVDMVYQQIRLLTVRAYQQIGSAYW
jgi:hypothetical protein